MKLRHAIGDQRSGQSYVFLVFIYQLFFSFRSEIFYLFLRTLKPRWESSVSMQLPNMLASGLAKNKTDINEADAVAATQQNLWREPVCLFGSTFEICGYVQFCKECRVRIYGSVKKKRNYGEGGGARTLFPTAPCWAILFWRRTWRFFFYIYTLRGDERKGVEREGKRK